MSSPKKSNDERAQWRVLCRQKLAEHIADNTGLVVKPEDVRLITSPEDPYRWSVRATSQHLFTKQLSKHCLRAYHEIYNGVGVIFEATLANTDKATWNGPERTFTAQIAQMSERIKVLEADLELLRSEKCEITLLYAETTASLARNEEDNAAMKQEMTKMKERSQKQVQYLRQYQRQMLSFKKALYNIKKSLEHLDL